MTRKHTELVREGDYMAEIDVELRDDEPGKPGWGPYVSLADALKIDDARRALRSGDLRTASSVARIYRLLPISAA